LTFDQQNRFEAVQNNVTVILRHVGERTKDLSYRLLTEQVPATNIVVISESPFSRAVQKSFELGIEVGRPWTLCIDADVLLRRNSVSMLFNWALGADSNIFQLQVSVFDKIFGGPRQAGVRLYRSSLLPKAVGCIPADGVSLRPETFVRDQMASLGYLTMCKNATVGLHDFEQYYRDIYRKAFIHAHKHHSSLSYLESLWQRLAHQDPDYQVALWGLRDGQRFDGAVSVDARRFPNDLSPLLHTKGWQEKKELEPTSIANWDVDKVMIEYGRTRASAKHQLKTEN
jgi:hypothetical protein